MKQLDINKSKDLVALKENLNNVIDKKITQQRLSEKLNEMKNLSFGEYKALYDDIINDLSDINLNESMKSLASYVKLLKENKAIRSVYRIIDHVGLDITSDPTITAYAWATILESVDKKQLKEGEQKMYNIYKRACCMVNNVTPERIDNVLAESKSVNDAVKYLTHHSNSSNINKLNERVNSINVLSNLIKENATIEKPQIEVNKKNSDLISELNNVFVNEYTEWENKVLKDLSVCYASGADTKELFEQYKTSCIEAIDSIDDEDLTTKSRLHGMKQQLMEKEYNKETLQEDLFKLAELKETILGE